MFDLRGVDVYYILGNESISSNNEEKDSRGEAETRMRYNLQDFIDTQVTSTSITNNEHHGVPRTKHKSKGAICKGCTALRKEEGKSSSHYPDRFSWVISNL